MIELKLDSNGTLSLRGAATAENAVSLRERLRAVLAEVGLPKLTIDLSGLTALDIAGLQILLAVRNADPRVALVRCPSRIERRLRNAGLESRLLDPGESVR